MPEIIKTLSLSTGHLPQEVREDMDTITTPGADFFFPTDWRSRILATKWFDYGWFTYVPEDIEEDLPFPAALSDCLDYARRHRAEFIKFDVDAEPVTELTLYE